MTQTDKNIRPRRSALYMPGANVRALEKARTLEADCLILDLEDSVAPEAKPMARTQICTALREGGYGGRELVVRVNALASEWRADDLAALAKLDKPTRPDAVLVPKISTAEEIDTIVPHLPDGVALWIMVETPQAIFNIGELAARAIDTPLTCFVMGTNDLAKELHATVRPGRAEVMTALSLALLAARQYGLVALDGAYNDIADDTGFAAECMQGVNLGFDGKALIHPSQLAPCHEIYGPSPEMVQEARAIIAAFDDPSNAGRGVLKVNGKMTELLHADMARRTLAIAEAIAANTS